MMCGAEDIIPAKMESCLCETRPGKCGKRPGGASPGLGCTLKNAQPPAHLGRRNKTGRAVKPRSPLLASTAPGDVVLCQIDMMIFPFPFKTGAQTGQNPSVLLYVSGAVSGGIEKQKQLQKSILEREIEQ